MVATSPTSTAVEVLETTPEAEDLYLAVLTPPRFYRNPEAPLRFALSRFHVIEHAVVATSMDREALLAWARQQGHRVVLNEAPFPPRDVP